MEAARLLGHRETSKEAQEGRGALEKWVAKEGTLAFTPFFLQPFLIIVAWCRAGLILPR